MKAKYKTQTPQKGKKWSCPSYRSYGVKGCSGPMYHNGGAAKVVGKATGYGTKGVS